MKTHEEMTKNVIDRIHAYEEEKRARRTKLAMTAVPVCAVAAIGVGLWSLGVFRSDDGLLVNRSADSGASPAVTEMSAETVQTVIQTTAEPPVTVTETAAVVSDSVQTVKSGERGGRWCMVGETSQFTISTTTTTSQAQNPSASLISTPTSQGQNPVASSTTITTVLLVMNSTSTTTPTTTTMPQQIHLPNIVFPPDVPDSTETYEPDYTLIYDFGDHIVKSTPPPKPYDIWISEPLIEAMEYYGANAPYHYLVTVEYFDSDGNIVHFSTKELAAEANRLSELVGYVGTAVETVNDKPPYLVLNGSLEEIQAFPGKAGYGCFLHLRDEAEYLIEE